MMKTLMQSRKFWAMLLSVVGAIVLRAFPSSTMTNEQLAVLFVTAAGIYNACVAMEDHAVKSNVTPDATVDAAIEAFKGHAQTAVINALNAAGAVGGNTQPIVPFPADPSAVAEVVLPHLRAATDLQHAELKAAVAEAIAVALASPVPAPEVSK